MPTRTKDNSTKKKAPATPFEASQDPSFAVEEPGYSNTEFEYRSYLLKTIEDDRNRKESPHVEYNGMTYTENYRNNMLAANSYTPPRQNAEDTQVVTGTTREKVLAIVSAVLNLNFQSTFKAFDTDDMEDEELAEAMTDCVERANKIELWDDKKLYAYFEMATQGDVYVEELFVDETTVDKKPISLDDVTEEFMKSYKAETKLKLVQSMCQRNLIPGTQVFKGNMKERDIRNQPHIFTVEYRPYEVTKSIYGNLPRFGNVPRKIVEVAPVAGFNSAYGINWRLDSSQTETCEIIKYQDRFNKEYQLIINGVMMLPIGFPLPWGYGEYNIVQGKLEPISAFFSESKSIPCKTKLDQEILDEMYRMAVLKTQKSFMPPIANYSTNILSRSMFLPGKVNNGLNKGELEVVGGNPDMYSLKPSEFQMIEMIKKFIDEKSISPAIQGQQGKGGQTATEINTVMQQAKQQLGLLIFGFIQFHMNLDMLRLYNVLENYTKDIGQEANELKDGVVAKYRTISISKDIGGKGAGVKKIQFTENHNTPMELYDQQEGITRDENGKPTSVQPPKKPLKIMQINPKVLRSIKYTWYNEVVPVERDTAISDRISFEDRLTFAINTWGAQAINNDYAQHQWALKNKLDASDFFTKGQPAVMGAAAQASATGGPGGGPPGQPAPGGGTPQPGKPLQQSNMNKQLRPFGGGAGPAEAMRQGFGK